VDTIVGASTSTLKMPCPAAYVSRRWEAEPDEAAACACPVVMGPHTFNFAEAAEAAELSLAAGAALRAQTIDEAVAQTLALLNSGQRGAWAKRVLAFAEKHRGVRLRMAQRIARWLA